MREFLKKRCDYLVLLGLLAAAAGAFAAYHVPGRLWRAVAFAREPQRVRLHDLAARGPGENRHVVVTDYVCGGGYAYEYTARASDPRPGPDASRLSKAWIPLHPTPLPDDPASATTPTSFVVLLETTRESVTPSGHLILSRRREMAGLVLPYWRVRESGDVRSILANQYPDTDFDKCLILEAYTADEREVATAFAGLVAAVAAGGLLLGLPTFVLGYVAGRAKRAKYRVLIAAARKARADEQPRA